MLSGKQIDTIHSIIKEPIYGEEFWTPTMIDETLSELELLDKKLNLKKSTQDESTQNIKKYLKSIYGFRKEYFNALENGELQKESEYQYRTAYGSLIKKQAICHGHSQAERMLLGLADIETSTLLSKSSEPDHVIFHYATCIENKKAIFDPWFELRCEKKGWDFDEYIANSFYMRPNEHYCKNKLVNGGLGIFMKDHMATMPAEQIKRGEEYEIV